MAVNSMVGHILGLGDRHPSNVLLDRATGKVVHIDFGDCFEVAMTREKFPERIPFRLTRMIVNAMEVRRRQYPKPPRLKLSHRRFPVSKAVSEKQRR
jgi:phosphatidylinositol kinase/protein kinase (PI-3  family)